MRKALVVGIDKYQSSHLNGCVNDASAFATVMEKNGDGSPNFAVRLETDVSTKSQLKSMITELFSGDNDVALLYYSGHGFLNELGGYIVTPDYKKYDEGVSMDDILLLASKSKAKEKIIILDCCHSGAFGSPAITDGVTSHINSGTVVLTASRDSEAALEVNGHGVFTSLLLHALQGGAADLAGHITPGSVYAHIDQALGPWEQRPIFKKNVSRFVSLRTISPTIPLEDLRKITEYFLTPEHEYALDPSYEDTNKDVAKEENVAIFKNLQKFQSVGLVVPVDAEFMYFAAQNSKSCKLTALGYHYWRLVKDKRL